MIPHQVIPNFLSPADILAVNAAWPGRDWAGWHRYENDPHRKGASNLQTTIPAQISIVIARMAEKFIGRWGLIPDLSLHGAGLHEMHHGDLVGRHLDAEVHPRLGLSRVLSMSLYVHERWETEWGGVLNLGDRQISPMPGTLVVFNCQGEAWHSVSEVRCPEGTSRRSLALFWYDATVATGRTRAFFEEDVVETATPQLATLPTGGDDSGNALCRQQAKC